MTSHDYPVLRHSFVPLADVRGEMAAETVAPLVRWLRQTVDCFVGGLLACVAQLANPEPKW